MNNFMRHFIVKLLCDEMECKDISEIAGFAFRKNVDLPYGYIYGGYVLPKAEWDEESYPYAFIVSASSLVMYVSATPFAWHESYDAIAVNAPYGKITYDYETKTWGELTLVTSGSYAPGYEYAAWSNRDITKPDGSLSIKGTEPEPFYLNDPDMPTAFLYTSGAMAFQSHSTPDGNIEAAFVKWDTEQYSSQIQVPWYWNYAKSIASVTVADDAIPAHTDYWFYNCYNLGSASLPEGLRSIGSHMFYQTTLTPISIPSTVEEIGERAYAYLKPYDDFQTIYRKSIIIPDRCKKIGKEAFMNAELDLNATVTIGAGCEEIGRSAFYGNATIRWVTIGASVKRIHPNAFYNCGRDRTAVNNYDDTYCRIEFKNTEGWWVNTDANATEGIAVDVSDEATAAKMLAGYSNGSIFDLPTWEEGTYLTYYWNRSENGSDPDEPVEPDEPVAADYYLYGTISASGTIAASDGEVFARYNGAVLPPLPEWDSETYPYVTMRSDSGYYGVVATKHPLVFEGKSYSNAKVTPPYIYTVLNDGETDWHGWEVSNGTSHTPYGIFWTNYDMQRYDGSVLSCPAPIPLVSNEPVGYTDDNIPIYEQKE